MSAAFDNDAIAFAERVLTLLDSGSFNSTYKYAVLLGLLDVVMERTGKTGLPPQTITTEQLAEKIVELYWMHTNQFPVTESDGKVLLQNKKGQAEIITLIDQFRSHEKIGTSAPLFAAKQRDRKGYQQLVRKVEWKLVEMPLPKLQRFAGKTNEVIYRINWDDSITQSAFARRGLESGFDNQIYLRDNVGEYLVRLNSLLRPLIQREWAKKVAGINQLQESRLHAFLFDASRVGAAMLSGPLSELQHGRCFYCDDSMSGVGAKKPEVDHFIPWARYPNDSVANYVVAHGKCNRDKRDFLAGNDHVEKWVLRYDANSSWMSDLATVATQYHRDLGDEISFGVTSGIYQNLRQEIDLWKCGDEFEKADIHRIRNAFAIIDL